MKAFMNVLFWILISVVSVIALTCVACLITSLVQGQSFFETMDIWLNAIKSIFAKAPEVEESVRFLIK